MSNNTFDKYIKIIKFMSVMFVQVGIFLWCFMSWSLEGLCYVF